MGLLISIGFILWGAFAAFDCYKVKAERVPAFLSPPPSPPPSSYMNVSKAVQIDKFLHCHEKIR